MLKFVFRLLILIFYKELLLSTEKSILNLVFGKSVDLNELKKAMSPRYS